MTDGGRAARWGLLLVVLAGILLGFVSELAAGVWPNCDFNCTAGDVTLTSVYAVVSGGGCELGGTSTAQIYGRFTASAKRYAVILIGDLHVEGGATRHLEECAGDLAAGTTDILLASISWPCGSSITLANVIVSWSANPESCTSATCASRTAKCSSGHDITVSTPLVVDFISDAPQCLGAPIAFSNVSTGGTGPYTYSWTFGDGETSSQANPSHTYSASGTYVATFTVRDRAGTSGSRSRSIVVSPLPAATAGNAGPYCAGATISLVSSGGTSYAWTGPNGFSSALQNPTIPAAGSAAAGEYSVTVTSAGGCIAQASTTVVVDSTPPVLTAPADVTVACSRPTGPAATGQASATDDSGHSPAVSYSDVARLTDCGGTGTITRTWMAVDSCGNSTAVVQTITVVDETAPALVVPADVSVECGHSILPAVTGQATAADACGIPIIVYADHASLTNCGETGTIARTWTADDACGNQASGVQTITVVDSQPPVLNVPADITVACGGSTAPAAIGQATATDGCSATTVVYADEADLTGCSGSGTIVRTWTAEDACGHVVTGVQIITVADATPPLLTVPGDVVVECGHSTSPEAVGHATATDDCSMPVVTYADEPRLTGCGGTGTILRTWTAADACGHTTAGAQTILVVDTRVPSLTVPGDVTIEAGHPALPSVTGQATATDDCSSTTVTYSDVPHIDVDGSGTITRRWTATDSCGHATVGEQTITVVGAPPPPTLTLSVPADVTVEAGYPTDPSATGTAFVVSTCPTAPDLAYSDATDLAGCDGTGMILRTWTASDACGNSATEVQTILVVDTGGLLLTVPADATIEAGVPADPSVTGWATASDPDAVDEPPAVTYSDVADLAGCDPTGTILRTWTATDECGNAVSAVQAITVIRSGHMRLAVPDDVTVETGEPTDPTATGWATVSDPGAGEERPVVAYSDVVDLTGCSGTGTILRTWTATDVCGSLVSAVQVITVADTLAPTLAAPADVTIETVDSTDPSVTGWASVGYHDPDNPPTLAYSDAENLTGCDGTGVILRTWQAVDLCGNAATAVQTITVLDSGHVSLLVPPDAVVSCDRPTSPDVTGWATASDPDAIFEAPDVRYSDTIQLSTCGGGETVLRTWTAEDECGNAVSAIQTITRLDATPPTLVVPPDVTVEYGHSTEPVETGRAAATDTCSAVTVSHTDVELPGACVGQSTLLRTWSAADECGNSTSGLQTITIVDTSPPALVLPSDVVVECGDSITPAAVGHASAADASQTVYVTYTDDIAQTGCGESRTVLRTWTTADACGNTTTAVQTITVVDSVAPLLTIPGDITVQVGQSTLPAALGVATATDACSTPVVMHSDLSALDVDGTGAIARTWTATDACGNSSSAIQTVTVARDASTELTLDVPANRVLSAGEARDPSATGIAVATSTCPGGVALAYEDDAALDGCEGTGVIRRTWAAEDACGNRLTGVQIIAVVDSELIELTIPGDVTLSCGESLDPAATGVATASEADSLDEPPAVVYSDVANLDPCSGAGTVLRTWTATDACGNAVSAIQTITVTGTCAPRVIISEVAWAGTGASSEEQWIELRNLGDAAVDLAGWTLRWRPAKREVAGDEVWRTLPLSGVIAPAAGDMALSFGPNPQDPASWYVDLSSRRARGDFYLLERLSDQTVLDVEAGLVYDDAPDAERALGLSDRGDVLELVSPGGCVIDTANAAQSGIGGWAAGDDATRGTMERTDPDGGDVASNWHTNLGIITSGEDAGGVGLLATAGLENEPQLARLVAVAAQDALPIGGGASVTIPLPARDGEAAGDSARIVTLAPGTGTPVSLPLGVAPSGGAVTITASGPLPSGQHAVWVRIGEVALLVLVQGP